MIKRASSKLALRVVQIALLGLCFGALPTAAQKGQGVVSHARGTFEVKLVPQQDSSQDQGLTRMTIDKQFQGDLEGTSQGQMLATGGPKQGSGGYVAIERVNAKLAGNTGTFVLQHNATMDHGKPDLNIIVVPDSGTDQLAGITGKLMIEIKDGKHFYDFEYTLPAAH